MGKVFAFLFATLFLPGRLYAQSAQTPSYADSADGFRQQLEDLVAAKKSGDEAAFRSKIDAFAIPNLDGWIAAHFSPTDVPKLQTDFQLSSAGFQESLTVLVKAAVQSPGREMMIKSSEPSVPPSAALAEESLSSPIQPIAIECFHYGLPPTGNEGSLTRLSSFVYLDGKFRYVGGIFPFWWHRLELGPVGGARLIHHVNPEYPKTARKQHIEGVVMIYAIIGEDGAPHDVTVITGDPSLSEAAIKAVQQWRYQPSLLSGVPIETDTFINVDFQLKRKH